MIEPMKFLVFIAIVVAAWYGLRWIQEAESARRQLRQRQERGRGQKPWRGAGAEPDRRMRATDTVSCSRCGAYVPSDYPTACGRADCPFPGVG